ncbi:MAG: transporter [Luteimonas sp.]
MKRSAMFFACLLAIGGAQAADGITLGVGVDYSSGDYGSATTTEILSVPFSAKYTAGQWSWKASVPWLRVSGDPNVLPGVGLVVNTNPQGRGRGQGAVTVPGSTGPERGTASGIGDLNLSATYSFNTGGPFGIDLTGKAKVATADENTGLGTGANDYGLAVDVYRVFGTTTLFGGVGYTALGNSNYVDVTGTANVNLGASRKVGASGASIGVMYDWREAASSSFDDRSEVTGFYSFGGDAASRFQVYATAGLSDGSPAFGGGVSYSHGF